MGPSRAQQLLLLLLLSTSLLSIRKGRVMVTSPTGFRSLAVGVQPATCGLFIVKPEDSVFGYLELWVVVEVRNDWSVECS